MSRRACCLAVYIMILVGVSQAVRAEETKRITILYDSYTTQPALVTDWGFAAFVEYGGRRILFDTGNNATTFEHNVKQLSIDLSRLDAVVISHRHDDHTNGLAYLLRMNPDVTIYVPQDDAFLKGKPDTGAHDPHGDHPPVPRRDEDRPAGPADPWEKARFKTVTKTTEIFPGFYMLTTRMQQTNADGMNEASLAFRTPKGLAVVVGCSHPGVERILAQAARLDTRLYTVTGGFHLIASPSREVHRTASALHDVLKIERVAPSHCTSDLGFTVLHDRFKGHYDRAGLGAVIPLP